jgi:hypothetical protein
MKAFPWQERLNSDDPNVLNPVPHGGMDLRDYFAAKALQALLSQQSLWTKVNLASLSYEWADHMMKAREQ